MTHEIDFTTGKPAIAYMGERPWHGFGQEMEAEQPLEKWIVHAGMNYKVVGRPIMWNPYFKLDTENPEGRQREFENFQRIKGKKVLVRSDTWTPLGTVSDGFKVVQPKAIAEFFRELIKKYGFKMHTMGVLAGGNRPWALAETGEDFVIPGTNDKVGGYLLLATSYDGKFSTTAQFTSIRVVCNNTLSWSLERGGRQTSGIVRVPHSQHFDADVVKGELGLLENGGWNEFKENVIKLSDVKITKREAVEFFLELLGVTEDEAAEGKQLINAKKLISFYESGPGSDFTSAKNTTWGLVNAVTFFTDHGRRAHNNGTRFSSAAFGEGAKMKERAYNAALELAEAA